MSSLVLLGIGMAVVLGGVLGLRLHPFLALILGALAVALATSGLQLERFAAAEVERGAMTADEADALASAGAMERVAVSFGETCGKIGILIAMAAIIGEALLASGAASRIVQSLLRSVGAERAGIAFLLAGFILAVPVFFDTVFYLLMPLGIALYRGTRKNYLLYVLCIVAGATMAHSLVPPTPGPLFVAEELGVGIGAMIAAGGAIGLVSVGAGYGFARIVNARVTIVPQLAGIETDAAGANPDELASLPPLWISLLPIALPLVLIGAASAVELGGAADPAPWREAIAFLGNKNIALILAALAALATLAWKAGEMRKPVAEASGRALASGAVIVLITSAGGAFGGVLQQTGIALELADLAGSVQLAVLPLIFLLTALVRTAQGSATVAMITAAPVAVAFAAGDTLAFHPVYLAVAIGCGSKPYPWMNDSGFWIITRMAGLRESDTLRYVSVMMSLMGVAGLAATMLAAWALPLR